MQQKKRALGKGLEALLPPKKKTTADNGKSAEKSPSKDSETSTALIMAVTDIKSNPDQPRQYFDEDALESLADSLKRHGLIQPVAVIRKNGDHIIVAGERRWRAAQKAGLEKIPVVILDDLSSQELLEYALVENLQRENLNAIEEAKAYQSLVKSFGLSLDEVAERVGRSRSAISNTIRLLQLPNHAQTDIVEGRLSPGHARAVLSLESPRDQETLRQLIMSDNLTVRQAEEKAVELAEKGGGRKGFAKKPKQSKQSEDVARLQDQIVDALACKVVIKTNEPHRGKIEIHYDSLDELQRILSRLGVDEDI